MHIYQLGPKTKNQNKKTKTKNQFKKSFVGYLNLHCIGKILFVGEDEEDSLAELVLCEHAVQLVLGTVFISSGREGTRV